MSAKFVNLIEFFECKIFLKVKLVRFPGGSVDGNAVVPGIYAVNMGPQKKFTVRQGRYGDAGMMDGYHFFRADLFLAVK